MAAVLLGGCVATVTPTAPVALAPTPPPSVRPSPRPRATLPPAKCATMDETHFGVFGWRGSRVELERARFIGCDAQSFSYWSVDPATSDWRIDAAPGVAQGTASDGHSVAMWVQGQLFVIAADGSSGFLPAPKNPPLAGEIEPAAGGGYVFVGMPRLDRLAPDLKTILRAPLPAGFAVAAPTSDPNRFILALASEAARIPWGLTKEPYHAYLWRVGTATPRLLSSSVSSVAPSATWLDYLQVSDLGERAVAADGTLRPVRRPMNAWYRSPDDREYLEMAAPDSETVQTITLRSASTGLPLARVEASPGYPTWNGTSVAFVTRAGVEPELLVVLSPGSTLLVPLP